MPRQIALLLCFLFIAVLYVRDRKLRPMSSPALWIALLWIVIVGSRPVSLWLGKGITVDTPEDYLDGSPFDRNIFLILIIATVIVLAGRRARGEKLLVSNRWFFAFLAYCAVSVLWSDYTFVSFKRWIKELGNVMVVIMILTEREPVQAFRAVFARYTTFALPLSVVLIKYYPELGRYYNRWTWEPAYSGITTNKNELGIILVICGLFLVWDLVARHAAPAGRKKKDSLDRISRIALFLMLIWLLMVTGSSTAVVCMVLGTTILFLLKRPIVRRQLRHMGTYSALLGLLLLMLYTVPGMLELVVHAAGRDMTFTGRTDIWADLLKEPINPIVGTGYQSFWLGPGAERMWEKYYFHPTQAHNGYLETYLNGGVVGLFLLAAMLIATGRKLRNAVLRESSFGTILFTYYIVALFYNWTEAMFNMLSLLWLVVIFAALYVPAAAETAPQAALPRKPASRDRIPARTSFRTYRA